MSISTPNEIIFITNKIVPFHVDKLQEIIRALQHRFSLLLVMMMIVRGSNKLLAELWVLQDFSKSF